eukprot:8312380-Alexandrium_andersonii.AAC.3
MQSSIETARRKVCTEASSFSKAPWMAPRKAEPLEASGEELLEDAGVGPLELLDRRLLCCIGVPEVRADRVNAFLLALIAIGIELGLPVPRGSTLDLLREGSMLTDAEPPVDVAGSPSGVLGPLLLDVAGPRRVHERHAGARLASDRLFVIVAKHAVRGQVDLRQEMVVRQDRIIILGLGGSMASPPRRGGGSVHITPRRSQAGLAAGARRCQRGARASSPRTRGPRRARRLAVGGGGPPSTGSVSMRIPRRRWPRRRRRRGRWRHRARSSRAPRRAVVAATRGSGTRLQRGEASRSPLRKFARDLCVWVAILLKLPCSPGEARGLHGDGGQICRRPPFLNPGVLGWGSRVCSTSPAPVAR